MYTAMRRHVPEGKCYPELTSKICRLLCKDMSKRVDEAGDALDILVSHLNGAPHARRMRALVAECVLPDRSRDSGNVIMSRDKIEDFIQIYQSFAKIEVKLNHLTGEVCFNGDLLQGPIDWTPWQKRWQEKSLKFLI